MNYDILPCGGALQEEGGACNREVFERVWRRVMPEERPDCPITLDQAGTAPQAPAVQNLPAASGPEQIPPAVRASIGEDNDVPCLGAASAIYGAQLQEYIDQEIGNWKTYQAMARRAGGNGSRVLSTIAADERRHAKRLSTAYFLISGARYWPVDRITAAPMPSLAGALRSHFADEQRAEASYLAAADETADLCLRELYLELAGDEHAHIWLLRGILEQM
ncbi:MAG: rubrerythrin [Oscillospiraceae bacterium]|nr:rubrerythrin [Oscillospiraceae bacterium]